MVVTALVNVNVAKALALPFGAMTVYTALGAVWKWSSLSKSEGELDVHLAALIVTVAVVSNTIVKIGIAWFSGGRRYAGSIAKVVGATMVIGIVVAVASLG